MGDWVGAVAAAFAATQGSHVGGIPRMPPAFRPSELGARPLVEVPCEDLPRTRAAVT